MSSPPAANHTTAGVNQTTPYTNPYNSAMTKFNPSMAIIIVVLIGAFLFMGFFAVYVRKCAGTDDTGGERPRTSQAQTKNRGLAKDVVEALPIVHFKDVGEKEDIECPVCLSDFEPEDSLRMLPKCKHVFHLECIDVWFQSHSTCPLCRASLLPDGCDGKCEGDGAAEQENGVMVEPQEVVPIGVPAEVPVATGLVQTPNELPAEEETAAPGPVISRGDERNSARDALHRNSMSFKRAVRGVAALEMAESPLRVEKRQSFNKLPTPTNLPIRRSNSLGTDIKSIRSYFINSEGTLHGTNLYVGTASKQGVVSADSLGVVSNAPLVKPQDHWITIDLEGESSSAKPPVPRSPFASGTARVSRPERWSFNSLRGVFPLSRSASDLVQQDHHLQV